MHLCSITHAIGAMGPCISSTVSAKHNRKTARIKILLKWDPSCFVTVAFVALCHGLCHLHSTPGGSILETSVDCALFYYWRTRDEKFSVELFKIFNWSLLLTVQISSSSFFYSELMSLLADVNHVSVHLHSFCRFSEFCIMLESKCSQSTGNLKFAFGWEISDEIVERSLGRSVRVKRPNDCLIYKFFLFF